MRIVRGPPVSLSAGADGRSLLLSMRRVADLVGYVPLYEFEDVIADLLGSDMGCVLDLEAMELSRKLFKVTGFLTQSKRLGDYVRRTSPRSASKNGTISFSPFSITLTSSSHSIAFGTGGSEVVSPLATCVRRGMVGFHLTSWVFFAISITSSWE